MVSSTVQGTDTPSQSKGFFEEDSGKKSSMRLMSFTALIASIGFGLVTILHDGSGSDGIYITFGFLLAAFAPKTVQKFAEQSIPSRIGNHKTT